MIRGVSHITFIVHDLDKTAHFLKTIFDAEEIYDSGDRPFSLTKEKFFLINGLWIAIMEGNPLPEKTYNHVAFAIDDHEFEQYKSKISHLGVEMKTPRNRVNGEGRSHGNIRKQVRTLSALKFR
ncbi:fosmidomycin resistance protein [Sporolactobacillus laevolacticus DSM 442]|uniref:Fosmidomycin resistance protein n=1 Tax=Sporolactobacillus laevolacticus DSM 442 TaxID=1395513 RepID=V6IUP5_9BACL|nr:VOC family protein [Sporolactobacillus laevolacticus]EST10767.1 fosmidomycin resistance protein [Sporolactobacillus laevolacticus DSM 442]